MILKSQHGTALDRSFGINLNLHIRGLEPSATLAINELSSELSRTGLDVFRFGLGQSPFPVPEPVVDALKENAHQKDYLPVKGLYQLREAVADYHCRKQGIQRKAENVLIGPGSKELMFLIQLSYYGDLVIPTPSWVSYAPQAQIIGRNVRWLATRSENNWLLMPEEIEELCENDPYRPRLLILNSPNNPTGHAYDRKHLQALAKVARKYQMVLLSDEIYGEIHHEGKHISIAEFYPEGTIISTGLSKWCGAGGWRLGTFTFPDSLQWLLEAMAVVASETYTSTSAPIQYAAVSAFQGGEEIETYLLQCRRVLKSLGQYCYRKMLEVGIKVHAPQGAFYFFPSFSPFEQSLKKHGIQTSRALSENILQRTGVATIPGVCFGRPEHRLVFRMAYVDFDGAAVLARLKEIPNNGVLDDAFLEENCPRVTTGIERLCDWVRNLDTRE
ncbi:MAG: aminotransferase class I/II-fold pyridoxal phosphate-dependent enzyme [Calditrichaeota bacterium]|nr:MAG: aminotransferase class I/II-fold pyridoxal phosphate-dependent enzyme [Calditrichota bacterium]